MGTSIEDRDQILVICAQCAGAGTSCCVHRQIYVTPGDFRRIRLATGQDSFAVLEAAEGPYLDQEDDPAWSRHVLAQRERMVLKRRADGSCHFLGERGCVLDLSTRPLLCRLYPYEYVEGGLQGVDGDCPVARCGDPEHALRAMGMASDSVTFWHRQLYEEIRFPSEENPTLFNRDKGD